MAHYKQKYFDEAGEIWKNLVPRRGQADSVQGELLRIIEKLRYEAQNNGNANWDRQYRMLTDYLLKTLIKSNAFDEFALNEITSDIKTLQNHMYPQTEDDIFDRISDRIVEFCKANPTLIPHIKNPKQDR
ncbi:hypothetical protein GCM10011514_40980 [Emticicia aquatilis]|uniref:Uncharacterized protein n=1 Tax=Emticicia aquatilis TaxID=1537369 RepID=A0A916Z2J6_9BACT|nr:hypothetical protein [Emticicia aquatilis]GGD72671.1 hypothetical protein GCM10011514_40980 [Emticicia aquatilis]